MLRFKQINSVKSILFVVISLELFTYTFAIEYSRDNLFHKKFFPEFPRYCARGSSNYAQCIRKIYGSIGSDGIREGRFRPSGSNCCPCYDDGFGDCCSCTDSRDRGEDSISRIINRWRERSPYRIDDINYSSDPMSSFTSGVEGWKWHRQGPTQVIQRRDEEHPSDPFWITYPGAGGIAKKTQGRHNSHSIWDNIFRLGAGFVRRPGGISDPIVEDAWDFGIGFNDKQNFNDWNIDPNLDPIFGIRIPRR